MEVFIVDIHKTSSMHHNGMIYEAIFMDFAGNTYNSYIDPKNRNYKHWDYIITNHFKNDHGYILKGLKLKSKTQINADSKPTIQTETTDRDAMLDIINEEIMYDPRKAIFNRLFDLGK